ncbi:Pyrrolo-quinoline quinone repeat-containing protein [Gemmatirosa kalamazoonensis]|uniref:Pyrrolo-quinoline quinone repeat-containing protein n=1 Tax=Gemmatirosa kalamazoonensis TaxID=861299 RepID=W0RBE1_9BACT|nr:pyrroloquinoline quinone-dependent dehydrogenase [Gemmatirosa kalamazoonensis]AHG88419.1 Pyrrolo-quinoline quinone repeat-containing protein [Gemmatirosa kalamazoonensis]
MKRALVILALAACARGAPTPRDVDWPVTGGEPGNSRHSPLAQIDRTTVKRLRVAWIHHTGDASPSGGTQIQATPVVVHGVLYATSPTLQLLALRGDTGEELWRFDPWQGQRREIHANRGVAYWESPDASDRRVFVTAGRRLWAVDAASGKPVATFGHGGWADLADSLGRDVGGGYLIATSPGVVYRDLLIQGTRVSESEGAAPGHVRAFDVRTGRVRWTFHTIPRPGEHGAETWPEGAWSSAGGANSWPGMSLDTRRGVVFVPLGSATPDFYGGDRAGANLYANALVALDAATGRRLWHFQTVHHDVWDRDLPTAPNLVTLTRDGRRVDAAAQITKSGFVFVFDRETGRPLFPVEERPAPPSDLSGERTWPTQPIPVKPAPFARQSMTEADLTDLSPAAHDSALHRFRTLRHGGLFDPPSREGTVVLPGFDGGGEWGGAAVDRETGVLYVNASDVPWIAAMREVPAPATSTTARTGADVYAANCVACHKADRRGDGDRVPSLVGVGARLSTDQIQQVIRRGRGFMPAFPSLTDQETRAVAAYLLGATTDAGAASRSTRYRFAGYERWRGPDGYPAIKPPWGTLSAIDLNTGEYRWRIPLGEHAALTAKGIPPTGTEQYGGPIVTAGGLVFIAATMDEKIRAFDKDSGALLWEAPLPAAGYATPSTYAVGGRQYVVVAAGGGKLGTRSGDAYVAFALPE